MVWDGWRSAGGWSPAVSVCLPDRLLCGLANRQIGKLETVPKTSCVQLVLEVLVCSPGGENRKLRAIIDTGSQINTVRKGLFAQCDFTAAKNPVQLFSVSGQSVEGGKIEIGLRLTFACETGRRLQPFRLLGTFLEADDKADIILGYPWMKENLLVVMPELDCLARRSKNFDFLPIRSCPNFDDPQAEEINTRRSEWAGLTPPTKRTWKKYRQVRSQAAKDRGPCVATVAAAATSAQPDEERPLPCLEHPAGGSQASASQACADFFCISCK